MVLTCAVEGLPAPSIIWLRDGLEVIDRKAKTYQGRENTISELHIASVEKHHFGKYTCQATNTIGIVVSKEAMLSLTGKRPLKGKYILRRGGKGGGQAVKSMAMIKHMLGTKLAKVCYVQSFLKLEQTNSHGPIDQVPNGA